jgi:hypothetical protein
VSFYNTPERISYRSMPLTSAASTSRYFKGPAGKIGKIVEISAAVTTTFRWHHDPRRNPIGDGVTATKYADLVLGSVAAEPAAAFDRSRN